MNRLIILGNGFDLSHGIKSSFNDFITDYFCNVVNHFIRKNSYSDPLIEIKFKYGNMSFSKDEPLVTKENIYRIINDFNQPNNNYRLTINSELLQAIYEKTSQLRWVDIEIEFFEILLKTKKRKNSQNIEKLNEELEFLKSQLIKYLDIQESSFSNTYDKSELTNMFCQKIYAHDIVTTHLDENKTPENLYFLNFNYTNIFEDYFNICKQRIPSKSNYIHGSLGGIHGNPIFGFGDEFDKRYVEFEDEHNNMLFKHIKSFEYLKTKNYFLLTRFIESNDFQVHIYGHSCGISDRTMLNQIFEHDNCKSIKIFYHKIDDETNDFTEKTYEISRHFKDKGLLRRKLVPFDLSQEMPQPNVLSTTSVTSK